MYRMVVLPIHSLSRQEKMMIDGKLVIIKDLFIYAAIFK